MGVYHERVLPHLVGLACGTTEVRAQRERVVPLATGQMAFANGAVIPVDGGLSISRL